MKGSAVRIRASASLDQPDQGPEARSENRLGRCRAYQSPTERKRYAATTPAVAAARRRTIRAACGDAPRAARPATAATMATTECTRAITTAATTTATPATNRSSINELMAATNERAAAEARLPRREAAHASRGQTRPLVPAIGS